MRLLPAQLDCIAAVERGRRIGDDCHETSCLLQAQQYSRQIRAALSRVPGLWWIRHAFHELIADIVTNMLYDWPWNPYDSEYCTDPTMMRIAEDAYRWPREHLPVGPGSLKTAPANAAITSKTALVSPTGRPQVQQSRPDQQRDFRVPGPVGA